MLTNPKNWDATTLAKYIDHTLLSPEAAEKDILRLCEEARQYSFRTVCIDSRWVPVAVKTLAQAPTLVITVIGFPSGSVSTESKVRESQAAVAAGARELDMVLNRELIQRRDYRAVEKDIASVVQAGSGVPVKVILETSELSQIEKIAACAIAKAAGASFVKTSTGFSRAGATVEDVRLMREVVGQDMGVKASGGVRTFADAVKMIEAGATRLGTSASVQIVTGAKDGSGGTY